MGDVEKFMQLVYPEPNTGCWLWAGRHDSNGYGRGHFKNRTVQLAHRWSYIIAKGPITNNLCVLHKCDNPACVNPDHLYLGDQKQNNSDRDQRGRQKTKRGEDHKLAKLTEDSVIAIRALHNPKTYPTRKLSKMFGVSQRKIMDVLHRKSWHHLQ
jgi:hypothetical protein